jgi:hypothetical protein
MNEAYEEIRKYDQRCKKLLIIILASLAIAVLASSFLQMLSLPSEIALIFILIAGVCGGLLIINGNTRKYLMTGKAGVSGYALLGILLGFIIIPLLTSLALQKLGFASSLK